MRRLEVGSSKLPWGRASLKESGTSSEWDEYVHDLHQMRLKHVRADVKEHMKTPRSLIIHQKMFPTKNAGALQRSSQQEERYLEIERANRALLNRLSSVMRKPGDVVSMVLATANANTHATLNEGTRKKELKRIDNENEKLISRIERGGSTYSRKAWAKDRNQQEKYLKNLSRYRNGPQATALRVAPNLKNKKKRGKRGRLRVQKSSNASGEMGDFTGYMDWRRQKHKHKRKKNWTKSSSLPPLENELSTAASAPTLSFEHSSSIGRTRITETSLGGHGSQSTRHQHHAASSLSPPSLSPLSPLSPLSSSPNHKNLKPALQHGQPSTVPNHTKVFETGRSMNGVFAVVSAITRGSSLIIQAFVPEDQTTTEVEVSPAQAKYAMRHVSSDIFRPEKREELCRALVAKVEFFFKDSQRMLLFNKTSTAGNPTATSPGGAPTSAATLSTNAPPTLMPSTQEASTRQRSRKEEEAEEVDEEDNDEFRALEGVFQLIPGFSIGGNVLKTKWCDAVNQSDRVKTVLRSEILCGYPSLRALRVCSNYQNALNQLVTKTDNRM